MKPPCRYVSEQEYYDLHRRCVSILTVQSAPFVRRMCDLKLMFCNIQHADGQLRETWLDPHAEAGFRECARMIETLQSEITEPLTRVAIRP